MKSVKKLARSGLLALSLLALGVPVAYAGATDTTATQPAAQDDGFDWGWLGLLGLAGLAGLRGRDRDRR